MTPPTSAITNTNNRRKSDDFNTHTDEESDINQNEGAMHDIIKSLTQEVSNAYGVPQIFKNCRFVVTKTYQKNLRELISTHLTSFGATVESKFTPGCTHMVLRHLGGSEYEKAVAHNNKVARNGTKSTKDGNSQTCTMVTVHWVEACSRNQKIIPVSSVIHSPLPSSKSIKGLEGAFISCSGFRSNDRHDITYLVNSIGATYTEEFSSRNTHLICLKKEGQKFEQALEWIRQDETRKLKVVSREWLFECVRQWEHVPEDEYSLIPGPSQQHPASVSVSSTAADNTSATPATPATPKDTQQPHHQQQTSISPATATSNRTNNNNKRPLESPTSKSDNADTTAADTLPSPKQAAAVENTNNSLSKMIGASPQSITKAPTATEANTVSTATTTSTAPPAEEEYIKRKKMRIEEASRGTSSMTVSYEDLIVNKQPRPMVLDNPIAIDSHTNHERGDSRSINISNSKHADTMVRSDSPAVKTAAAPTGSQKQQQQQQQMPPPPNKSQPAEVIDISSSSSTKEISFAVHNDGHDNNNNNDSQNNSQKQSQSKRQDSSQQSQQQQQQHQRPETTHSQSDTGLGASTTMVGNDNSVATAALAPPVTTENVAMEINNGSISSSSSNNNTPETTIVRIYQEEIDQVEDKLMRKLASIDTTTMSTASAPPLHTSSSTSTVTTANRPATTTDEIIQDLYKYTVQSMERMFRTVINKLGSAPSTPTTAAALVSYGKYNSFNNEVVDQGTCPLLGANNLPNKK